MFKLTKGKVKHFMKSLLTCLMSTFVTSYYFNRSDCKRVIWLAPSEGRSVKFSADDVFTVGRAQGRQHVATRRRDVGWNTWRPALDVSKPTKLWHHLVNIAVKFLYNNFFVFSLCLCTDSAKSRTQFTRHLQFTETGILRNLTAILWFSTYSGLQQWPYVSDQSPKKLRRDIELKT